MGLFTQGKDYVEYRNAGETVRVMIWGKNSLRVVCVPNGPLDMSSSENREKVRHKAICRVKDKFGGISKERICPHCHNTLPEVIGRYPNYIFSMIGNTSSGKTVYLQRLKSSLMYNGLLPRRQMSLQLLSETNLNVDMETKKMFVNTVQMQERLSEVRLSGKRTAPLSSAP